MSGTTDDLIVRALSTRYPPGSALPAHSHGWGQLVYASEGVMTVHTPAGSWVVPSHRAVWIPPGVEHWIEMSGTVFMQSLYLAPALAGPLPDACGVMEVPPLLKELIRHAAERAPLDRGRPEQRRLAEFLLDQLRAVPAVPLALPMPRDPRAVRVAEALRADPSDDRPLADLGRAAGASPRTLERLFRRETGLTFGRWRQQLRLLEALRLIAAGRPITSVALDVGYESTSAFITMFRSALGTTPGRYYARLGVS